MVAWLGSRERDDRSGRRKCRGSRLEGEALAVDSRGGGRWWLGDCSEGRVLAASPLATVAERRSRSYSRVPLPADEGWSAATVPSLLGHQRAGWGAQRQLLLEDVVRGEMAEAATTAEEGDGDVSQRKKERAGATTTEEGDSSMTDGRNCSGRFTRGDSKI
ncbi:hypothetical protein GW17_00048700 [Ensete ventricosum]|nr:hypothetical protein GW17_00048700 [Ensete ventricosum]